MSAWKLITDAVTGKCHACQKVLSPVEIVYEWRGRKYHDGCLLDTLTAMAPPDPVAYPFPGMDWQAP